MKYWEESLVPWRINCLCSYTDLGSYTLDFHVPSPTPQRFFKLTTLPSVTYLQKGKREFTNLDTIESFRTPVESLCRDEMREERIRTGELDEVLRSFYKNCTQKQSSNKRLFPSSDSLIKVKSWFLYSLSIYLTYSANIMVTKSPNFIKSFGNLCFLFVYFLGLYGLSRFRRDPLCRHINEPFSFVY